LRSPAHELQWPVHPDEPIDVERGQASRDAPMEILYLLVPLATLVVGVALVAFRWALRTGQFDDLETPPMRAVFDEHDHEKRP
jgi:cbb3-type cytochrome oxidase maturation protein